MLLTDNLCFTWKVLERLVKDSGHVTCCGDKNRLDSPYKSVLVIYKLGLLILPMEARVGSCNCILCGAIETAFYGMINLLHSYITLVSRLYGSACIF